jgi:RNA polymerase sigma-70 factor (ECF subfamily)
MDLEEQQIPTVLTGGADESTPESAAYAGELRRMLEEAVDRLPDGAREVFMLREVEGLSTAETADVLGIADDAVKTRLSRAKRALRRDLLATVGAVESTAFAFHQPRCDRIVAAVFERIA